MMEQHRSSKSFTRGGLEGSVDSITILNTQLGREINTKAAISYKQLAVVAYYVEMQVIHSAKLLIATIIIIA